MAEMLSIKMSKFDNQPWGFRLQGGIDFCAPLTVQKVNGGSLAEKAGLRVGDALIRVNTTDIFQLRHKEAQDAVARAGNNFELVVSRGGGMPKTAVKPNDVLDNILPVAAPPAPVQQKTDGSGVKIVNRQFNSPMGLYSEESIAETLSSQAEVLSQGVLGVNFKKNDKTYDPGNSEVFKMIQEMDKAPKEPEPERHQGFAHSATPTHKPMSFNSPVTMVANNFGGSALSPSAHHPPPVGGVRIFPAAPAPVKPQVKPAAVYGPPPPAVKSVSFTPAARPSGFGSAAAVAASAAMAAQAQHQAPQLAPQPPKGAGSGIQSAPRRGKGVLNQQVAAGARVPVCSSCKAQIRGKFVTALGQTWCPNHFSCAMPDCKRELHDIGFVEEKKQLYCEGCFETHLAPNCSRCSKRVKGDCLNAIGKQFHPECFSCTYCGSLFGNSHFYLEDGLPYCEADWNELFTTKCYACGYPIEAGDRWVEAMNNNYHSQCFNCSVCKKNLEGQSFLGKGGRPMCKSHAR
uniref:PDZ and LIM domain protein Zasp n=1 Tax=Daphnia magna TaxID=35525 RepID=A0A0P5ZGP5_9CRUS